MPPGISLGIPPEIILGVPPVFRSAVLLGIPTKIPQRPPLHSPPWNPHGIPLENLSEIPPGIFAGISYCVLPEVPSEIRGIFEGISGGTP